MLKLRNLALLAVAGLALAGCERNPLIVKRSACPAVAVPTYAGDITFFKANTSADAANIDIVAAMTNVRETCVETATTFASDVTYDIIARRSETAGARSVKVPVFASVVQGGNLLLSKEIANVTVNFADGQARAVAKGGARANVARSIASLSPELQARISRKRKPGDLDAAVDPLADPEVRAALRAASFEVLVGFQLSSVGLAYNVTK